MTWSLWIKSCPLRIKEVEDEKVEKMEGMETKEAAVTGSVRLTGEYVLFNLLLHCWTFNPAELEVFDLVTINFFWFLVSVYLKIHPWRKMNIEYWHFNILKK